MSSILSIRHELYRKGIHLTSTMFLISLWYFGSDIIFPITVFLAILSIIIDYGRMNYKPIIKLFDFLFGKIIRSHEKSHYTGATWFLIGTTIVIGCFDLIPAIAGLVFLTIGDSFAAIIGKSFGRTKIQGKTLEGSLAFFLTSSFMIIFIPGLNIWIGIITALLVTFIELFSDSLKVNDNILIPISSAFFITIMTRLFL